MPNKPGQTTGEDHLPELGTVYVIGSENAGFSAVLATIACNTALTDAQLIAAPPNTVQVASGVVVHSLGVAPTLVFVQPVSVQGNSVNGVTFGLVTANNSAAFIRAHTQSTGFVVGVAARVIVAR